MCGIPNPLSLGGGEIDDWTISPDDSPAKSDRAEGFASPRRLPSAVSSSAADGGPSLETSVSDFASAMKASTAATVARLVDIATEREGSGSNNNGCQGSKTTGNGDEFGDGDKNDDSDETLPASPEPLFPALSLLEDALDGLTGGRAVKFGVVQQDSSISRLPGKRTQ